MFLSILLLLWGGFHLSVVKPKYLLWLITTVVNYPMNQSELEANTCNWRKGQENAYRQVNNICFGFTLIGRESGARFFSQSQIVAMQNQSNCKITFRHSIVNCCKVAHCQKYEIFHDYMAYSVPVELQKYKPVSTKKHKHEDFYSLITFFLK